ncbi:DUF397 domain-containing protein [Fodinicola acaciae]|uniref:DUF397 domain-containing protein n=1 Tax=Fodinicola acaciae TaxID=2681555 RepID=UPI0013D12A56|nr:DUF397 domain-containing protein [Fodinicola acaciae]
MNKIDNGVPAQHLGTVTWRKSRYSGGNGNCVEVGVLDGGQVAIRDSKDPHGPALVYSVDAVASFVARAGELRK